MKSDSEETDDDDDVDDDESPDVGGSRGSRKGAVGRNRERNPYLNGLTVIFIGIHVCNCLGSNKEKKSRM